MIKNLLIIDGNEYVGFNDLKSIINHQHLKRNIAMDIQKRRLSVMNVDHQYYIQARHKKSNKHKISKALDVYASLKNFIG